MLFVSPLLEPFGFSLILFFFFPLVRRFRSLSYIHIHSEQTKVIMTRKMVDTSKCNLLDGFFFSSLFPFVVAIILVSQSSRDQSCTAVAVSRRTDIRPGLLSVCSVWFFFLLRSSERSVAQFVLFPAKVEIITEQGQRLLLHYVFLRSQFGAVALVVTPTFVVAIFR